MGALAASSLPCLKTKRYSVVRRKSRGRPVQQIAAWLGKLGLEQYAKRFSDNDIDVAVLPHLSDQDLKDLGVSLGHRRKIFAAVNKGIASVQPLAEAERAIGSKSSDAFLETALILRSFAT